MRIEFVEIANFRKLLSTRVGLSSEKTIFVGANNSGKTSAKLGVSPRAVQAAIRELINLGICYEQIDGVIYDRDGLVVAHDAERVVAPMNPRHLARTE